MTATARDRILRNLQKTAPPAAPGGLVLSLAVDAMRYGAVIPVQERLDRLETGLKGWQAQVVRVAASALDQRLVDDCAAQSVRRLALPASGYAPTIPHSLDVWRFDAPIEATKSRLFHEIDAGLTLADCGIAETGTLVIRSTVAQPRTLSLVPPVHICLLDTQCIYSDLVDAVQGEGWAANMPTNLIMVSGPSKTADIQQTLAYGAHGPKALWVYLVDGLNQRLAQEDHA